MNFLTGPGNEGEIAIDFETRFAGMAKEEPEAQTEGKWMTGEYHSHSIQSSDASEPYITVENALNAAFREDLEEMPAEAKVDNIQYGEAFDYFMLADHLRNSPATRTAPQMRLPAGAPLAPSSGRSNPCAPRASTRIS